MISELAKKIGVTSERVIKKSEEYERLSRLKTTAMGKSPLNGMAKLVLCIDLAASSENYDFDKVTALKLSGLKRPAYLSLRLTLKQLLGISENISIEEFCNQLGCQQITDDSKKLLKTYFETKQNGRTDVSHPGFMLAAIVVVAKSKKISLEMSRVRELCSLKKLSFDALVATMSTIVQQNAKETSQRKRPHSTVELSDSKPSEDQSDDQGLKESADQPAEETDFASWKKRILEEAKLLPKS